jgi:hypothetical protein
MMEPSHAGAAEFYHRISRSAMAGNHLLVIQAQL